ncbi:hypothetical protein AV530_010775 [Patagioenas fasciata monilis]|uniref:Uncharacterized protein n=1 Tax=Patagioenas fasciata monilis TaxID=372326 RepID=A0A1V4K7X0_PATFA|nr:hypothetical protein AV530_010775 [Patagioenas fasciata monilis]
MTCTRRQECVCIFPLGYQKKEIKTTVFESSDPVYTSTYTAREDNAILIRGSCPFSPDVEKLALSVADFIGN